MPNKKKKAKKQPKRTVLKAKPAAVSADLSEIRVMLPVLSAHRRAALRSLYTEEQCEQWGAKTKSSGVYDDGCRFALVITPSLNKRPDAVVGYTLNRAAWMVECLDSLSTEIAKQNGGTHVAKNAVTLRAAAEVAASKVIRKLRRKLRAVAGGDETNRKAIADGTSSRDHDLVTTLTGLASTAKSWMASKDAHTKELVDEAKLSDADTASAEGAAKALRAAREGKTLGGIDSDRDTPPVNRAEGRVLREMRWAMECFEEAHEEDSTIPKLVPSAATRSVLAPTRTSEDDAPPATTTPPQATAPTNGTQA